MGVTGLWKLIEQSGKPVPLETLENKVLAVGMLEINFPAKQCSHIQTECIYLVIPKVF